jgi:hypothetical protein
MLEAWEYLQMQRIAIPYLLGARVPSSFLAGGSVVADEGMVYM